MPHTQLEPADMQQSAMHCVALGITHHFTDCFMLASAGCLWSVLFD